MGIGISIALQLQWSVSLFIQGIWEEKTEKRSAIVLQVDSNNYKNRLSETAGPRKDTFVLYRDLRERRKDLKLVIQYGNSKTCYTVSIFYWLEPSFFFFPILTKLSQKHPHLQATKRLKTHNERDFISIGSWMFSNLPTYPKSPQ